MVNFLTERDEALRTLDLVWARKQFPLANDETLLVGLHKARYICTSIDRTLRLESAAWLRERGFNGLRMPLLPEGELPE